MVADVKMIGYVFRPVLYEELAYSKERLISQKAHFGKSGLMSDTEKVYFTPALFNFLRQLAKNNNRDWFSKNKDRYVRTVQSPSLQFIKDMQGRLKEVSPYLVADPKPFGGSMFRIYRDIRFSKDKSPYKTNVAMDFWHREGGKVHSPGLYLHLAPGKSFVGAGVWHPDPQTLNKVRMAIVNKPDSWKRVLDAKLEIEGDSLKLPPKGFDPNHQFIQDLKRKDFIAGRTFKDFQIAGSRFAEVFLETGKSLNPLNEFIANAIGLPW